MKQQAWRWLIVMFGYIVAAKLGLLLAIHAGAVSPIWPPTGVALAALLVWGWPMASAIMVGATTANLLNACNHGSTIADAVTLSAGIGLGNTLGPVVAAVFLRHLGFDRDLHRIRDVWWLFAAGALGAFISALDGVGSLMLFSNLPWDACPTVFVTWWVGDSLGYVGFAPVLLVRPFTNQRLRDLTAPLLTCAALTSFIAFDPSKLHEWMPTVYLTLLPLVWLGVRGGNYGVALGYVISAVILVVATNLGFGQMSKNNYHSPLIAIASFLTISAILAHLLGVWSSHWQTLLAQAKAKAAADERFRILFEQSSDAHLLFDASGIVDCNSAAIQLLRCPDKVAVLNLHPAVLSPEFQPDGAPSLVKCVEMDRLARVNGHHRFEWIHRRADGTDFPVEVSLTPVRLSGRESMLVVWHDLTAHKQAEEAIARARDLAEEALRAKSEFLATMSHELRTPLNGVIGFSTILRATELNPEQLDHAETIHSCAEHLLALINDILDLSRLEADKVDIEDIPCELSRLTGEVMAMVHATATAKGLALSLAVAGDLPPAIRTDPGRLRQILINLLGNAVKFTAQGSVTLGLRWAEGHLICTITDTGIGIDQATVARLFQPFVQADASMARRYGGSGLGLAISRRLADLLGATLSVTSTPGQGSAFTLDLPATACLAHPPSATTALPAGPSRRILVVEDNLINQRVVTKILTNLGHQVTLAENGLAALERLGQGGIDVVFMDCQMPIMDGLEATRRLRAMGFSLPIIAMTANALAEDKLACREAGMDDHLAKPISLKELQRVLAHLEVPAPGTSPP